VLNLAWAGVDLTAGVVRLEPGVTKNRAGREFPIAALPPLAELLKKQRDYTTEVERRKQCIVPHVFHRDGKTDPLLHRRMGRGIGKAGVDGRLVHDLRRMAVRNLERAGVSRSVAMKLTGHKTEAVYRRYAITSTATSPRVWPSWQLCTRARRLLAQFFRSRLRASANRWNA